MTNTNENSKRPEDDLYSTCDRAQVIDEKELLARVGGDWDLLGELVRIFAKEYPGYLKDLDDAMDRQDGEALHNAAHRLKGTVGNFSGKLAFQAAVDLETLAVNDKISQAGETLIRVREELSRLREALERLMVNEGHV